MRAISPMMSLLRIVAEPTLAATPSTSTPKIAAEDSAASSANIVFRFMAYSIAAMAAPTIGESSTCGVIA